MELLQVSKKRINQLKRIKSNSKVLNADLDLYIFYNNKIKYLLKQLYPFEHNKYENIIKTFLILDANDNIIPEYFIKPKFFVYNNHQIQYWGSNYIDGDNLNRVINNKDISYNIRRQYLIRIGEILKEMEHLRETTSLKDFYLGDLHESNFIVDKGNIFICNPDSIKIGGNKSSNAKYLTPFSLFNKKDLSNKYKKDLSTNRIGNYIIDQNTDLYCYMIIILGFITGKTVNNMELKDFYQYLNYLDDIKVDPNLIEAFNQILTKEDNTNPYEYISSLTEEQVCKARVKKM